MTGAELAVGALKQLALKGIERTLMDRERERRRVAVDELVAGIVAAVDFGKSPLDEIARRLEGADDDVVASFFEAVDAATRTIDPKARTYLAKLAAPYIRDTVPRDRYLRRVASALADAVAAELEGMEALASELHVELPSALRGDGELEIRFPSNQTAAFAYRASPSSMYENLRSREGHDEAARFLRLTNLGRAGSRPEALVFDGATAARLFRLFLGGKTADVGTPCY